MATRNGAARKQEGGNKELKELHQDLVQYGTKHLLFSPNDAKKLARAAILGIVRAKKEEE